MSSLHGKKELHYLHHPCTRAFVVQLSSQKCKDHLREDNEQIRSSAPRSPCRSRSRASWSRPTRCTSGPAPRRAGLQNGSGSGMIWSRLDLFAKPFLAASDKHLFRCTAMGRTLVSHMRPLRSQHHRRKSPPTDHRRPAANTPPAGGPRRRLLFVPGDRPKLARTDTSFASSRHLGRCPRSGRRARRRIIHDPSRSSGRGCSAPWLLLLLSPGGGGA